MKRSQAAINRLQTDRTGEVMSLPNASVGTKGIKLSKCWTYCQLG